MTELLGIIITVLLIFAGTPIVAQVFKAARLTIALAPDGVPQTLWDALRISGAETQGKVLGALERAVSAIAVWTDSYELVVGLLAFKVASKWEVWSNVLRLPDNLDGVEPLAYLKARRLWGSNMLMRFLVGSFSNVLLGLSAAYIGIRASALIVSCFP